MNKIKKVIVSISTLVVMFLLINFSNQPVFAEEAGNGMGFSVAPILPATQIDSDLGYYYLETKPNKEQTFEVRLSSQKKEKQTIEMFVQDAYTGTDGSLTYGIDGIEGFKQDKTLINSTNQIITPMAKTIELEPGESKVVTFKVKPPEESYDGVKIGRLVFKPTTDKNKAKQAIVDEYQYAISIILGESGDEYNNGDLKKIELNEVKPTIKRGKRLVTANIQNPEPKRNMSIDLVATVTEKGSEKVIKQTKIPDFQFAPNSNVDLEIDWGLSELIPGEYTLNILAKNSYDNIHLTKDFRITKDESKNLNKESAFKIKTPNWVKIVAVINGIIAIMISVMITLRNKKWEKLAKKKRKNKKKNRNE